MKPSGLQAIVHALGNDQRAAHQMRGHSQTVNAIGGRVIVGADAVKVDGGVVGESATVAGESVALEQATRDTSRTSMKICFKVDIAPIIPVTVTNAQHDL